MLDASRVIIPPEFLVEFIADPSDVARLPQASRVQAVLASRGKIDASVLSQLPNLKFIQTVGSGYETIDLEAAAQRHIMVAHNPGTNAQAVAEHALMGMLFLLRRTGEAQDLVMKGKFGQRHFILGQSLRDLSGIKIGILGFGAIGTAFAELIRPFRAEIYYYKRTRDEELENRFSLGYRPWPLLADGLDILLITLPLTDQTHHMVNKDSLDRMNNGSVVVNVARGGVLSTDDLVDAMIHGSVYGAALDVFEPEPPNQTHPLLNLPDPYRRRVLLTPHIAGLTQQSLHAMISNAFGNILRFFAGESPRHQLVPVEK